MRVVVNSTKPVRISWIFDDLVSSDAHALRCRFSASVRIADTEADRRIFSEVFRSNGNANVTVDDVVAHFAAQLRAAALRAAAESPANASINDQGQTVQAALIEASGPVAFACGVELLPPFQIEIESPTLLRQRLECVQRQRAEERTAGQMQHLQRATELLREFQEMQSHAPSLSAGKLLDQVNPADRGVMLQTLLMASEEGQGAHKVLWAVAGSHLVRIDPRTDLPKVELFPLTEELGPLRSVQTGEISGRSVLLVGARAGIIACDLESRKVAQLYRDDSITSQLGFNRVVTRGDEIWACHGEAGLVGWKADQPSRPHARHTIASIEVPMPAQSVTGTSPSIRAGSSGSRGVKSVGPRNLQVVDDGPLLYSVGSELHVMHEGQDASLGSECRAEIIAIVTVGHDFAIVYQDGTVALLDASTRQITESQHRAAGICAAAALPFLGGHRILLARETGPIDCVGFDDPLVTQYLSPHRALRAIAAASDCVVAISTDRQRLIVWRSWDGHAPVAEIHLTAQTRHRIADIEFC